MNLRFFPEFLGGFVLKTNKLVLIFLVAILIATMLNSEFQLSSSDELFYNVSLSGAVNNPGVFAVPPSTRVSSVLKLSNIEFLEAKKYSSKPVMPEEEIQILQKKYETYYPEDLDENGDLINGSLRNVILKRGEDEIKVDLLRFFTLGDNNNNPYVMDGDVILIPAKHGSVFISGAVNKPGEIEYTANDKISNIIDLAMGVAANAMLDKIEVVRFINKNETEKIIVNYNKIIENINSSDNILIQLDDRIFVRAIPEFHKIMNVSVSGEVQFPGTYAIKEGATTLLDILQTCGKPTAEADLYNAFVQRQEGIDELDPEFERLKYMPVNNMNKLEYAYFKNMTRELKGKYSTNIAKLLNGDSKVNNLLLQDGDFILIPQISSLINVTGQVVEPGFIAFSEGKPFSYYIEQAGGLDWNARKSKIRLIRANTGKWTKPNAETVLAEGDIIFVPEKPEFDTWQFTLDSLKILTSIASIFYTFNIIYGTN